MAKCFLSLLFYRNILVIDEEKMSRSLSKEIQNLRESIRSERLAAETFSQFEVFKSFCEGVQRHIDPLAQKVGKMVQLVPYINIFALLLSSVHLLCKTADILRQEMIEDIIHVDNFEREYQFLRENKIKPFLAYADEKMKQSDGMMSNKTVETLNSMFQECFVELKSILNELSSKALLQNQISQRNIWICSVAMVTCTATTLAACLSDPWSFKSAPFLLILGLTASLGTAGIFFYFKKQEGKEKKLLEEVHKYKGETYRVMTELQLYSIQLGILHEKFKSASGRSKKKLT